MAEFSARPVELATVVVAAAIGLTACGGSSPLHVASLQTSSGKGGGGSATTGVGRSSTTKLARRDPTRLVDEWAACERSHGDPNQADPIIDAHGVINITTPGPGQGGPPRAPLAVLAGDPHDVTGTCSEYLAAAQRALRAADPVQDPGGVTNPADQLRYVACMRANGVSNYPYPTGNTTNFNGTGVDPFSPFVTKISIRCGNKLGLPLWWSAGWGPPGDVSVSMTRPPGAPPFGPPVPATGARNGGPPGGPTGAGANSEAGAGG